MNNLKPLVGVSQCLLGDTVRYDGKSKTCTIVIDRLSEIFTLLPVCPEVEAGLSIPRPPVQLTGDINQTRLTGRDDPSIDITDIMQHYCKTKPAELKHLCGFIFKSRSPSCGLNSTPVFLDGKCITESGTGIFAKSMCDAHPELAFIEDNELQDQILLNRFIQEIRAKYHPVKSSR